MGLRLSRYVPRSHASRVSTDTVGRVEVTHSEFIETAQRAIQDKGKHMFSTDKANNEPGRPARKLRALAAAVVLGSTLSVALIASGGTADAATIPVIAQTPQFDCGSAYVTADKPALFENGQSVTWLPEIEEYTTYGWISAYGQAQTVLATTFGQLAYEPDTGPCRTTPTSRSPIGFTPRPRDGCTRRHGPLSAERPSTVTFAGPGSR